MLELIYIGMISLFVLALRKITTTSQNLAACSPRTWLKFSMEWRSEGQEQQSRHKALNHPPSFERLGDRTRRSGILQGFASHNEQTTARNGSIWAGKSVANASIGSVPALWGFGR